MSIIKNYHKKFSFAFYLNKFDHEKISRIAFLSMSITVLNFVVASKLFLKFRFLHHKTFDFVNPFQDNRFLCT